MQGPDESQLGVERSMPSERLVDRLGRVGGDVLSPEHKRKLEPLCRDLDALGRLDERSGELFLDEGALRKMLRPHVGDGFVDELLRRTGSKGKVHVRKGAGGRALRWDELVQRAAPGEPSTVEALGLRPDFQVADVEAVLRERIPDAPEWIYDARVAPERIARALRSFGRSGSQAAGAAADVGFPNTDAFWSCVLGNVGFWAIAGLIVAIAGFIAAVLTGGALALAVAAAFQTFAVIWLGGSAMGAIVCFMGDIIAPIFQ